MDPYALLTPIGCVAMMLVCMKAMHRGAHQNRSEPGPVRAATSHEVAALRAEVAELRAERDRRASSVDG